MAKELIIYGVTYFEVLVPVSNGETIDFIIHQEPTAAQKEINDDDPPGPWPWWVASNDFTGGPYKDKEQAVAAIWAFIET